MSFSALVVDDEPLARDELKYLLSAHPVCRVVGEADDAEGALSLAQARRPDVVFLDIEMRGMSGVEAARHLLANPQPPLLIFATAYREHAVRAFELGAVDYLLKPVEEQRLASTIARIEGLRKRSDDWAEAVERVAGVLEASRLAVPAKPRVKKLPVEKRGEIKLVDYDEILFAVAQDGGVAVVTKGDQFTYTGTMAELEGRLGGEAFLRVHKSYLVNLNHVEGVLPWFKGTYWLVMPDQHRTQVPVSKSQVKELKLVLGMGKG